LPGQINGLSAKLYEPGTYYILDITNGTNRTNGTSRFRRAERNQAETLTISVADVVDVDRIALRDNNFILFYYIKTINMDNSAQPTTLSMRSSEIPITIPYSDPVLQNDSFIVYDDSSFHRYLVFDNNNIPIGYLHMGSIDGIDNHMDSYIILRNLLTFSTRVNPLTWNNDAYSYILVFTIASLCALVYLHGKYKKTS